MRRFNSEGLARVKNSWVPILQGSLAAGVSWYVAMQWFGHHNVFFAPMAAIIIIGLSGGDRLRRAIDLNVGVTLGVGLGDLLVTTFGGGIWQMGVIVAIAMVTAIYCDKSQLVFTQAGIGVVLIATIFPPGTSGGVDRMLDSFIGGTTAIVILALVPDSPLKGGRKEIAAILGIASNVLAEVTVALDKGDAARIRAALATARGTQANINNLIAHAKAGREAAAISPLHWKNRRRVKSLMRILNPVDNAMRNTRVLARRAQVIAEDHDEVSAEQIAIMGELAEVMARLSQLYGTNDSIQESDEIPRLTRKLRQLGARAGGDVADGRVLSAVMVLGQSRSLIVDLLQICGLSRNSSKAVLAPTSTHPEQPPELHS
ncbi:aromatic acid exporter family protein [Corynebacterium mendelii]